MGRRKIILPSSSPAQSAANRVKKRYSKSSPGKTLRVRRALYEVENNNLSVRKAASNFNLSYSFLQRRTSGGIEIESKHGVNTVFSKSEEEAMAQWLKEMAERGMGLKPGEFLDFVQSVVNEEKRSTPFTNGRPSYDWYQAFMARNSHIVEKRQETALEAKRAKLTKDSVDKWYSKYRDFVVKLELIEKPKRFFNADESGFSLGSKPGKVIGPLRTECGQVPHVSGGHPKERLTVMFCGAADGSMIPPYFVYPLPQPRGYNPLNGAMENSGIAYTAKGWMDAVAFKCFLEHFDKYCGEERPVILLIDSVSSHVNLSAFQYAKSKGIEMYRFIPNATHIMQPLDVGVFGPLKRRWHEVLRRHSRENPGSPVRKDKFAELLKEAFLLFYKPLTVINSFKSSGIYPIDSTVVTSKVLKPGLTFSGESSVESSEQEPAKPISQVSSGSLSALNALETALDTPVRNKYRCRIKEGYDIEGQSPCFQVYKRLYRESRQEPMICTTSSTATVSRCPDSPDPASKEIQPKEISGLDLLAAVVCSEYIDNQQDTTTDMPSDRSKTLVSPLLHSKLVYPQATTSTKPKAKRLISEIPDNLTSPEAIRKMALKDLVKVRQFAEKEKNAKTRYIKKLGKPSKNKLKEKKAKTPKVISKEKKGPKSRKNTKSDSKIFESEAKSRKNTKSDSKNIEAEASDTGNHKYCMGCNMSWKEDIELGYGSIWIQCDQCGGWIHPDCCSDCSVPGVDDKFICPECINKGINKGVSKN